jgi:putative Mn2+ efflux pump MntP
MVVAVGLAMDAFAVSVSSGMAMRTERVRAALRMALSFGSFQAVMPLIGWSAGLGLRDLITDLDHWLAFALLSLIGCRMIYQALRRGSRQELARPMNLQLLLLLSVATSIDALAVGISFAFLQILIAKPIIVIGLVTFGLSFLGVMLGSRLGRLLGRRIEVLGGLMLIGIGVKILIEHLA